LAVVVVRLRVRCLIVVRARFTRVRMAYRVENGRLPSMMIPRRDCDVKIAKSVDRERFLMLLMAIQTLLRSRMLKLRRRLKRKKLVVQSAVLVESARLLRKRLERPDVVKRKMHGVPKLARNERKKRSARLVGRKSDVYGATPVGLKRIASLAKKKLNPPSGASGAVSANVSERLKNHQLRDQRPIAGGLIWTIPRMTKLADNVARSAACAGRSM
jgi:hypothetical protein